MIDSIWRGPGPEGSRPAGKDILAEERERRRSRLRLVWPGNWFTGKPGIVFLVLFVLGGLGWARCTSVAPQG